MVFLFTLMITPEDVWELFGQIFYLSVIAVALYFLVRAFPGVVDYVRVDLLTVALALAVPSGIGLLYAALKDDF